MATIRKRKNSKGEVSYHVQIRRKGYATQTKSFDRRADAETWSGEIERAMRRGEFQGGVAVDSYTLKEALDRYEKERALRRPDGLADQYRYQIGHWKAGNLANRPLSKITPADIARWRDEMVAKGRAPSTIINYVCHVSNVYELARTEWALGDINNPTRRVKWPRPRNNGRDRRLATGELDTLREILGENGNEWIAFFFDLALETAARRGELLKLQWRDVDLKRQIARLRDTKNGEDRAIPLSKRAVAILDALPGEREGRCIKMSERGIEAAWQRARAKLAKRLKIDERDLNLRFHDLRHEAVSRLFERGFDTMEAAAVSGHKTLQMLKRYTHLKPEDLAKKLDKAS